MRRAEELGYKEASRHAISLKENKKHKQKSPSFEGLFCLEVEITFYAVTAMRRGAGACSERRVLTRVSACLSM